MRINYYPPRGDNKEGWDNIDLVGWLGYPMQLKINFLCRDSILAAPIVLDVALFLDLAKRAGLRRASRSGCRSTSRARCTRRALSGARSVHSADEAEEHAALHARRGTDHASRARVLRLSGPESRRIPDGHRWDAISLRCSAVCSSASCRRCRSSAAANVCCCLWVVAGGVLDGLPAAAGASPSRSRPAEAVLGGLIAGLIGAVICVASPASC